MGMVAVTRCVTSDAANGLLDGIVQVGAAVQGGLDVRVPHEALKDVRGNLRGVTAVSTPQ